MGDFDTRSFWVFTSFPVRCHTDRVLICSWMPPFLRYVDRAYWKDGMPGNEKSTWLSFQKSDAVGMVFILFPMLALLLRLLCFPLIGFKLFQH